MTPIEDIRKPRPKHIDDSKMDVSMEAKKVAEIIINGPVMIDVRLEDDENELTIFRGLATELREMGIQIFFIDRIRDANNNDKFTWILKGELKNC